MTADGGSSPMVKPKGDKQVEYLDLDLDPGKSTPPRKVGLCFTDRKIGADRKNWRKTDHCVFSHSRRKAMEPGWQRRMSAWTMWLWTSNGHRP